MTTSNKHCTGYGTRDSGRGKTTLLQTTYVQLLEVELARCTQEKRRGGGAATPSERLQVNVHAHWGKQRAQSTRAASVVGCRVGASPSLKGSGRSRRPGPLETRCACRRGARRPHRTAPGATFSGWRASWSGPDHLRATAAAGVGAPSARSGRSPARWSEPHVRAR